MLLLEGNVMIRGVSSTWHLLSLQGRKKTRRQKQQKHPARIAEEWGKRGSSGSKNVLFESHIFTSFLILPSILWRSCKKKREKT